VRGAALFNDAPCLPFTSHGASITTTNSAPCRTDRKLCWGCFRAAVATVRVGRVVCRLWWARAGLIVHVCRVRLRFVAALHLSLLPHLRGRLPRGGDGGAGAPIQLTAVSLRFHVQTSVSSIEHAMHENVGDFLVRPDRERIFHTRAGGGEIMMASRWTIPPWHPPALTAIGAPRHTPHNQSYELTEIYLRVATRVRVEIMGSPKGGIVGKSPPVLDDGQYH
jgi:hypothetical protein